MPLARLIAIIDDEESVRKALVRLLRSAGFQATALASGQAFLQAVETMSVDCLILDLQMPGMSGLDLLHVLRTEHPDLHIPVVMITAHDEPYMRERCAAAGAAMYFLKPVDGSALLGAVSALTTS